MSNTPPSIDELPYRLPSCLDYDQYRCLPKYLREELYKAMQAVSLMKQKVDTANRNLRSARRHHAESTELKKLENEKRSWVKELRRTKKSLNQLYNKIKPTPPETARAKPYGRKKIAVIC